MDPPAFKKITHLKNAKISKVPPSPLRFDMDIKEYIKKFNNEHKGKVNLLDFSQYTTQYNEFKNKPISKKDI